ncbi:MAG: Pyruvate dehydrogenase E1 component beta subunit, partial [uncultured Gemmatimonadaceae bacterium]
GRDHLPRSHPRGALRGDGARPRGLLPGRGHRRLRRRVQGHRGAARPLRRAPGDRHADLGDRDRRRGGGRGAHGDAAGGRDAVHRLHRERVRHAHQLRGHGALPRVPAVPDGGARAERRLRARRAVPLAEPRGGVRPHAGAQGRLPRDRRGREGADEGRHPRRRLRALLRAQVPVPPRQGRDAGGRPRGADRQGARRPRGRGPVDHHLRRDGPQGARRGPPARGRGRPERRGARPAHARPARRRGHRRDGEEDQPRARRARGHAHRRTRRRDHGAHLRVVLRVARRAGAARDRARRAAPLRARARGLRAPADGRPGARGAPAGRVL